MPKKSRLDYSATAASIRLRLLEKPSNAPEIYKQLGISQSTFSRSIGLLRNEVLIAGRGSKTRYAARHVIRDVAERIPILEIGENAKAVRLAWLIPVHPRGFYLESGNERRLPSRFFADLPYFLHDQRPSGFLGRLIPKRHPELDSPADVLKWTGDDCLRYLTHFGADLVGNLVIGEPAFARYLAAAVQGPSEIAPESRSAEYPKRAQEVLEFGDPGSSAGGEQPKFSAVAGPDSRPVLVKFSPTLTNEVAVRRADLLVSEHLALRAMAAAGHAAAKSELVRGGDRLFLELERFDRVPRRGRRGMISLLAIDAEFVGHGRDWGTAARRLREDGRIDSAALGEIRWRELFGRLIGNTDMHQANLSLWFQAPFILGVTPAYDMLPMLYAPVNEQLIERVFTPPMPQAQDADIWVSACGAAVEFWRAVGAHPLVSPSFRRLAQGNASRLGELTPVGDLLPGQDAGDA